MSTRKKFNPEFKRDAVSLIVIRIYSQAEAARILGDYAQMLSSLIKELINWDSGVFRVMEN